MSLHEGQEDQTQAVRFRRPRHRISAVNLDPTEHLVLLYDDACKLRPTMTKSYDCSVPERPPSERS